MLMDSVQLRDQYLPFVRRYWLPIIFSSIGILLVVIGITSTVLSENKVSLFSSGNNNTGVIIEEAASTERDSSMPIVVDVAGAVLKPGVYKLVSEARMQEALIAAGGLADNADREYISKNINLASKVSDGAKIYIPNREESTKSVTGSAGAIAGVNTGLVNINTASLSELDTLPGVGAVTSQKIVDNRPYASIDDLLTKKIVGSKVFGEIRKKISVY